MLNHGRVTRLARVTEFRISVATTCTPWAVGLFGSRVCARIQDCQNAPQMIATLTLCSAIPLPKQGENALLHCTLEYE